MASGIFGESFVRGSPQVRGDTDQTARDVIDVGAVLADRCYFEPVTSSAFGCSRGPFTSCWGRWTGILPFWPCHCDSWSGGPLRGGALQPGYPAARMRSQRPATLQRRPAARPGTGGLSTQDAGSNLGLILPGPRSADLRCCSGDRAMCRALRPAVHPLFAAARHRRASVVVFPATARWRLRA